LVVAILLAQAEAAATISLRRIFPVAIFLGPQPERDRAAVACHRAERNVHQLERAPQLEVVQPSYLQEIVLGREQPERDLHKNLLLAPNHLAVKQAHDLANLPNFPAKAAVTFSGPPQAQGRVLAWPAPSVTARVSCHRNGRALASGQLAPNKGLTGASVRRTATISGAIG
jgi:hypothetical protein